MVLAPLRGVSHALLVLWLAALPVVSGCAGGDAPSEPAAYARSLAGSGREWFRTYCASCHGTSARGDGPSADSLREPPSDLTRISARNAGRFDAARVARYIDGRTALPEHGTREMPIWGRRLDDRTGETLAEETRLAPGAIFLIVEYLRSIQETDLPD
jgi:mono/diheme cytochrome c family protein